MRMGCYSAMPIPTASSLLEVFYYTFQFDLLWTFLNCLNLSLWLTLGCFLEQGTNMNFLVLNQLFNFVD